jgi:hypothetical protein
LQDSGALIEQQKLMSMQSNEIQKLKDELSYVKRPLQKISSHDISDKNQEIEKLTNIVKNFNLDGPSSSRMSLEQLSESFNDLKFQQAM